MRRLSLLLLLTSVLIIVTAVGAHADYWPPEMVKTLLSSLP
jgi:hypothetical protein